ncbi:MAG: PHP domain-containing protein [Tissierellales bacterium]|jgi:putative hydrolase|nr:PHP domain-containing protein [Tissierellales bacterium]
MKNFKLIGDYHTHTRYSHGMGSIEDNVKAAISKNLEFIVIADHGPMCSYGVSKDDYRHMRLEIDCLNKKYKEIEILLGIEANIVDLEGKLDIDGDYIRYSDLLLAGFHFDIVYNEKLKAIRSNLDRRARLKNHIEKSLYDELKYYYTQSAIKSMRKYDIRILTHMGDGYPIDIEKLASVAAETNTYLEINNFHRYLNCDQIKRALKYKHLKFVINSDAHRSRDVGNVKIAMKVIEKSGLDVSRVENAMWL